MKTKFRLCIIVAIVLQLKTLCENIKGNTYYFPGNRIKCLKDDPLDLVKDDPLDLVLGDPIDLVKNVVLNR